jgi:hypothetical protein
MNDIDFGIGGDDDEEPSESTNPVATIHEENEVASPRLVEPSNPLENEESSSESSPAFHQQQQDTGMLGVQGNAHRGILSADLTALGSMMTGFS